MRKKLACPMIYMALACILFCAVMLFYTSDGVTFRRAYQAVNGKQATGEHTYQTLTVPYYAKLKIVTPAQALQLQNGILYFGYPSCPYCRNTVVPLLAVAKQQGVPLYYCDMKTVRDTYTPDAAGVPTQTEPGDPAYQHMLRQYDAFLDDYTLTDPSGEKISVGEKRIYVPLLLRLQNGQVAATWTTGSTGAFAALDTPYTAPDAAATDAIKASIQAFAGL